MPRIQHRHLLADANHLLPRSPCYGRTPPLPRERFSPWPTRSRLFLKRLRPIPLHSCSSACEISGADWMAAIAIQSRVSVRRGFCQTLNSTFLRNLTATDKRHSRPSAIPTVLAVAEYDPSCDRRMEPGPKSPVQVLPHQSNRRRGEQFDFRVMNQRSTPELPFRSLHQARFAPVGRENECCFGGFHVRSSCHSDLLRKRGHA